MNSNNPLKSLDHWEDDLLERYPEKKKSKKKADFRNYSDSERQKTVSEFYRLNHKFQTYEFVIKKEKEFLSFNKKKNESLGCN